MLIKIFSRSLFIKLQSTRNCHFPFDDGNRRTYLELKLVMAQEALGSSNALQIVIHVIFFLLGFLAQRKENIKR